MTKQMPKNAIQKMVRKTWLLYMQWEKSGIEVDRDIYLTQRATATKAIELGRPAWKKEFVLP